jgi:stress-induced morphogen
MTSTAEIEALIRADLRDARVDVQDTVGDGDHFQAVVVSSAFAGKPLVERHQLVYRSLKGAMADRIHALSLRTYTPEEFERVR